MESMIISQLWSCDSVDIGCGCQGAASRFALHSTSLFEAPLLLALGAEVAELALRPVLAALGMKECAWLAISSKMTSRTDRRQLIGA